jgi:hypothetical protein
LEFERGSSRSLRPLENELDSSICRWKWSLEEADRAWDSGQVDVSVLEGLANMLAQQLLNAAKEATGEDAQLADGFTPHRRESRCGD